jgi:hypothetical protein
MPGELQQVLERAVVAVERTTGLKARTLPADHAPERDPDALIEFQTPERAYQFVAEIKTVDRFETPALVKARGQHGGAEPILVAPYITRETAARCQELKLPFLDTAGNAYIQADGLFVYVVGNRRPDDLATEKFRALTPAGLQVTFALLCRPDLLDTNYRAIAAAAQVALGTVGPVMKDLQDRRLIAAGTKNKHRFTDPRRALDEWVTRYPTTLRPKLHARRFDAEPQNLRAADLAQHAALWGGEAAADRLTRMLLPAVFTIYTAENFARLAAALRLRAHADGNVEVVDRFWNFTVNDIPTDIVPPPLVYADLMATGDGRNVEIANFVYERFIEPEFHRPH